MEGYFEAKKISPRHAPEMLVRTVLLLAFTLGTTYLALSVASLNVALFFSVLAGLGKAASCACLSCMPRVDAPLPCAPPPPISSVATQDDSRT